MNKKWNIVIIFWYNGTFGGLHRGFISTYKTRHNIIITDICVTLVEEIGIRDNNDIIIIS